MKKNIKKKVMAGSMAVVMAAGFAGTYSYQNGASEVHAEEETKELTEAAENVLGDSDAGEQGEFCKEESVYVKADASGKISETTVTEWLKNPAKGNVEDTSELNDIKNIKGDEQFAQRSGGELNWQSEGDDIYYQGTTNKELPVDVKVSYKLDGKEIAPEDLEGKDGKVEIRFDYENKSKETVEVNGENVEMYTPFTMVTAMMLPIDEYKNVTIDNGKIVSDADKDIVVGVAFPGLEENLDLEELDVDIPDSLTITADVKDVSVGPTITLASAEIMSELGLDDVDSFDDLEDSINQLEDAADQLVDGSQAASDGASQLADGSKTLADGVNTLNDKSGDLTNGVKTLADGVGAYTGGVAELYEGSTALTAGAQAANAGAVMIRDGIANQMAPGVNALVGGYTGDGTQNNPGANNLIRQTKSMIASAQTTMTGENGIAVSLGKAAAYLENISLTSDAEVTGADEAASAVVASLESAGVDDAEQYRDAIKTALDEKLAVTSEDNQSSKDALSNAKDAISEAQASMQKAATDAGTASAYADGLDKTLAGLYNGTMALQQGLNGDGTAANPGLVAGSASLASGTQSLAAGASAFEAGAEQLYNNSAPLMAGVTALKEGGSQLAGGVGQLADGAAQVSDGANALAQGNQQLAEGMSEFKSEGIDKLTETFNGDIQNAIDRIDAMSSLAKNYKSFAGIRDGVSGKTKFVIETEGVD